MHQNATSRLNPLQQAQMDQEQARTERAAAICAEIEALKAQCADQLESIDLIVEWARRYSLGHVTLGCRFFDMEPMHVPDERGRIDYLTTYGLSVILNRGSMYWRYKSGTSFSNVGFSIHEDRPGFWLTLARVTPQMLLMSLRQTAERYRAPMPV